MPGEPVRKASPDLLKSARVHDARADVEYMPWLRDGAIGYRVTFPGGRIEYLYLVPCGDSDDGVPCVFVYRGPHGDPDRDEPQHYYDLAGACQEEDEGLVK